MGMSPTGEVPEGYSGTTLKLFGCDTHGAHAMLSIYQDGIEVAGEVLRPDRMLTLAADLLEAETELAKEVAKWKATQN